MTIRPIYLDYAATTPLDERVFEKMCAYLKQDGVFGNAASTHDYGMAARAAIEEARFEVADLIGAEESEIIWTSGATESNNLALKGIAQLYQRKGKHLITAKTEHKSVLDACQHLEKEGYRITYLTPLSNGLIDLAALRAAISEETILVSIMHVNNETGIIQDIDAISRLTSSRGIFLHVDAAQSPGKIDIDVKRISADAISLSAHKVYGPKGIGALYLRKRPRVRVQPLIHGGGHEQGMRSGTLPTHQIVAMGKAFSLAKQESARDSQRITALRDELLKALSTIPVFELNTDLAHSVPHIINFQMKGMIAKALLQSWPELALSTAAACQSSSTESSYVLRAMGYSDEVAKSAMRLSLGRFTTREEILRASQVIQQSFIVQK